MFIASSVTGKRWRGLWAILTAYIVLSPFVYNLTEFSDFRIPSNTDGHENDIKNDPLNHQRTNQSEVESLVRSLPIWLQDYIEFHRETVQNLNKRSWISKRYLIVRCYYHDKCGGTSDRIKGIPLLLLLAAKSNRTLFIRWTRPYPLEEFMLPVTINWTVPDWMTTILDRKSSGYSRKLATGLSELENVVTSYDYTIVEARVQMADGGGARYQNLTGGVRNDYGPDYHSIFRAVFQPSPPIAKAISRFYEENGLLPGRYAVAHQRARYARRGIDYPPPKIMAEAVNAVNCASRLLPGAPIFFASDSVAGYSAVRDYAKEYNRSIVTRDDTSERPLHLEFGHRMNMKNPPPPSQYYATFIDLWIMGNGRCVAFGPGGFGHWGLVMGFNVSCAYNYRKPRSCNWMEGNTKSNVVSANILSNYVKNSSAHLKAGALLPA